MHRDGEPTEGRIDGREMDARARRLSWLLFDVDGVLTDGLLYFGTGGDPLKAFDVRDGQALKLAQAAGLKVGFLSGRADAASSERAKDLGLDASLLGRSDKGAAFTAFLADRGVSPEAVAYVGDDVADLPVLAHCGLSFAPSDAAPEVRARAHVVLASPGGRGVARELVERVLRARGEWERAVGG